jgi:hypothetical protein
MEGAIATRPKRVFLCQQQTRAQTEKGGVVDGKGKARHDCPTILDIRVGFRPNHFTANVDRSIVPDTQPSPDLYTSAHGRASEF